jgi:hypothetical protein
MRGETGDRQIASPEFPLWKTAAETSLAKHRSWPSILTALGMLKKSLFAAQHLFDHSKVRCTAIRNSPLGSDIHYSRFLPRMVTKI